MTVAERIEAVLAAGGTVMVCREPGADVLAMARPGHGVTVERFGSVGGVPGRIGMEGDGAAAGVCEACKGSGIAKAAQWEKCAACGGRGRA